MLLIGIQWAIRLDALRKTMRVPFSRDVTGEGGILHELDVMDTFQGNAEVGIQGV